MAAPAVVEDLKVLEERPSRRRLGREGRAMHELGLQAAKEALHGRVVVAVAAPAHRAAQAMAGQELLVLATGILGGFKRSSQHLDGGACDGYAETTFGSVGARRVALARPA